MQSDDLMRYELQILQSIITCGGDPSLLGSNKIRLKEFKSCSTKQGETAKIDSFALYRLEEDDTVCFHIIFSVLDKSLEKCYRTFNVYKDCLIFIKEDYLKLCLITDS